MGNLPAAAVSPRVENGILYWYAGDTFDLELELKLEDQDGTAVDVDGEKDGVTVCFYDERRELVASFAFGKTAEGAVTDNTVTLAFDAEVSALFPKGKYTYDVVYESAHRRTLVHGNLAIVE